MIDYVKMIEFFKLKNISYLKGELNIEMRILINIEETNWNFL